MAGPPRERAEFFGINIPASHVYDDARLTAMAGGIASTGFGTTRITFHWSHMQYTDGGPIDWSWTDERVAVLARQGVRVTPTLFETPGWAVRFFECPPTLAAEVRTKCPPADPADFGKFAGLVARRYATGGEFWKLHDGGPGEDLLPALPIREMEIWNEPNGEWAFHPRVDPAHYGKMYRAALNNVKGIDSGITVIGGALAPVEITHPGWLSYFEFLDEMDLSGVEALSVHPYVATPEGFAYYIRRLRSYMDAHWLGAKPIYVTEFGWPSEEFRGDDFRPAGLEERPRGELLHATVDRMSRSDCNVAMMAVFGWDVADAWDTWGRSLSLTRRSTTGPGFHLLPETEIFRTGIGQLRGEAPVANRATVHDCDRPAPDRDGDGVQDQHDYAPLDSRTVSAPGAIAPSAQSAPYLRETFWATGQPARTTIGTWNGAPVPKMGIIRWEHCAADSTGCVAIPNSATQSLTVPDEAAGRYLRAVSRAQNASGTATQVSDLSKIVHSRPLIRIAPEIDGKFRVGATLSATAGQWFAIPNNGAATYRFYHCSADYQDCTAIGQGSANDSLRLMPQHSGRYIKVAVTVGNWLGTTTAEGFGGRVSPT